MAVPKPKTVKVDCSVCGQDWTKHKADAKGVVRLDECVRLLKAALAAAPKASWGIPYSGTATGITITNPTTSI